MKFKPPRARKPKVDPVEADRLREEAEQRHRFAQAAAERAASDEAREFAAAESLAKGRAGFDAYAARLFADRRPAPPAPAVKTFTPAVRRMVEVDF